MWRQRAAAGRRAGGTERGGEDGGPPWAGGRGRLPGGEVARGPGPGGGDLPGLCLGWSPGLVAAAAEGTLGAAARAAGSWLEGTEELRDPGVPLGRLRPDAAWAGRGELPVSVRLPPGPAGRVCCPVCEGEGES